MHVRRGDILTSRSDATHENRFPHQMEFNFRIRADQTIWRQFCQESFCDFGNDCRVIIQQQIPNANNTVADDKKPKEKN